MDLLRGEGDEGSVVDGMEGLEEGGMERSGGVDDEEFVSDVIG